MRLKFGQQRRRKKELEWDSQGQLAPSGVLAAVLPSGQQPNSVLSHDERSSAVVRVGVDKVGPAAAEETSQGKKRKRTRRSQWAELFRGKNVFWNHSSAISPKPS